MRFFNYFSSVSKFMLLLTAAAFIFYGCDSSDNGAGPDNGTEIEHSSTIESDETWAKADVHIIKGYVYVKNATLTIEPGSVVKFLSDAALIIDVGGGLIADGTSEAITFTGQTAQAGFWRYIEFQDDANNQNCKMINCVIEYGGGYSNDAAMLYIDNNLTITNCTIRSSSSNGVEIDQDAQPVFNNNTITDNVKSPINGNFKSAIYIGYGSYTGNGQDYINLSSGKIQKTSILKKQDVPYNLNGYNYIEEAILTIEAGVDITFGSDASLIVDLNGGLLAIGTIINPITFTGQVAQKGYWRYIEIQDDAVSASCKLDYCIVEYGGGYSSTASMIYVDNNATVTNSTIRNSSSHGIKFDDDAKPVFTGNTVTLNELSPVLANFKNITYIGTGDYTGNMQHDYLDIESGTFSSTATLLKQNVPYRLNGYNYVENGILTLEAGVNIKMNSDAVIDVNENGGLVADGTGEQIVISGFVAQNGYWRYIEFNDNAINASCVLNECLIEYGGGYSSTSAIIYVDNNGTVTNNTIQHSSSWGLSYEDSASPTISGNTFSDNTAGDITTH